MEFDFDTLIKAIGTAGETGTNVGKVAQGLSAVMALVKGDKTAGDQQVKDALSDLTNQLLNTQVTNMELKNQLLTLQQELQDHLAFQSDIDRYHLIETELGAHVLALKPADQLDNEPIHFLCPNCAEQKRKYILQGNRFKRSCAECGVTFYFAPRPKSPPPKFTFPT